MHRRLHRALIALGILVALAFTSAPAGFTASAVYTVRTGDTLWTIARAYDTTVSTLRSLNGIETDVIYPGQTLLVPSKQPVTSRPARIPYTEADLDLLARLVRAEAGGEPYIGMVAAAAVTVNRVLDGRFPDTLYEVIYQENQYEPVMNGTINQPAADIHRQAALEALHGVDPTHGAIGFYNPDKVREGNWVRQWPVSSRIGDHVFFHF